ncbi:MAG: peptidylprolyl isomerase [Treponema sp.]|nr:peptidylprolyl isomerase [Treponema sp.]
MTIAKDKMVSINYTLKDDEGTVIDSSNGTPLEYLHGNGNLIPGLEVQLEGKAPGDKFAAIVAPKDAYGEYDEKLVLEVPRNQFDSEVPIEIGMRFQADTTSGPTIVRVTKITEDKVTVDANHDLAGKTLHFDIEVVTVRDATEEELTPQSSCGGGCGGCGGGCDSGCGGGCSCDGGCN